jgi:hypothetical protein
MSAARLLRFLAILVLIAMPFGMTPAAQAIPATPAIAGVMADHCLEMAGKADDHHPARPQPDFGSTCTIACSALPSIAAMILPRPLTAPLAQPPALSPAVIGLHPEAATPPPRVA